MASSTNQNFIFMLILFLVVHKASSSFGNYSSTEGFFPFASKHVIIINKLVTLATLIVHCRNKGDDLGVISLQHLARFDFRFRVNLRKTTTYTCSFEWPGNTATFDIFRADRDDNPRGKYGVCSECIWSIYEPAPCRDRRDGGQPQCFPWAS
ncbi:S-protein homolog 5 [Arabidopsis lyrata subsp. lyrata]|uniref:S-protein homolog 5 n=1 Tax=Arabidopsis lyrata subsp. lyrata TaxID=81972 RepID=UPI000A29D7AB|nr:S-protein homolog 5 [Arabidopsis lyrata subsp. lyrata]|eukprot:XP_020870576.1 S-protein homolog 5 [Arabidopsis lyrata subsp. lyrata]